jgi:hypothetical protein
LARQQWWSSRQHLHSRILNAGENGDDDNGDDGNGAGGEEGSDEGAGGEEGSGEGNHGEGEAFDWSTIDATHILSAIHWKEFECPTEADFVECRESLALATLFFLCEELGDKFPRYKDQIHAGWLNAFQEPILMDRLLDQPSEISAFDFTEDESRWLCATI